MADKKKKNKKLTNPMRKFTDRLVGKGGNPGRPGGRPRGAIPATNTRGEPGYIDPKTQKFVKTGPSPYKTKPSSAYKSTPKKKKK